MDLYTPIYHGLMYSVWESLRGRNTLSLLHYLERTQWRSPEELRAIQVGDLRKLLVHANEQVPFYQKRLAEAGVDPLGIRDVEDLQRLPLLSREDAQAARGDLVARGYGGGLLSKSTSGTTGNPFLFSYNRQSETWRQAIKGRAYGWSGYRPGMKTVHYWGPPAKEPTGFTKLKVRLDRGLRREIYLDCAKQSASDFAKLVAFLRREQPQALVGFTQATVQLAHHIVRNGLRDWPNMVVLCGAERLYPQDRPVLEQAFGSKGSVYETYGNREFMLIGSECPAHTGLHVSMENLIAEVVDERGHRVAPGKVGQVVITDLHNYGMPLIRYGTGDLAVAQKEGDACPCGRGLMRLSSLEGRQADLLRGLDGRPIPGIIFNAVFANLGGKVDQFQAVQRKDGRIDLKVVPGPNFNEDVVESVRGRLSSYLGDTPLFVDVVECIPTQPSGKRRHVLVEA